MTSDPAFKARKHVAITRGDIRDLAEAYDIPTEVAGGEGGT